MGCAQVMWRDDAMACSHWWKPPINIVGILGLSRTGGGQRQTVQTTTTDRFAKKLLTVIAC